MASKERPGLAKSRPSRLIKPNTKYTTPEAQTPTIVVEPVTPKLTSTGKPRGRPRKIPLDDSAAVATPANATATSPLSSTPTPSAAKITRVSSKARAAQALEDLSKSQEDNAELREQITRLNDELEALKRQFSYTGQTVPKVDYDMLVEKHSVELNKAKSAWWCAVCKQPSRYYCCWNTTYCTVECQKSHWYQRHKYDCLRQKGCHSNTSFQNNDSRNAVGSPTQKIG